MDNDNDKNIYKYNDVPCPDHSNVRVPRTEPRILVSWQNNRRCPWRSFTSRQCLRSCATGYSVQLLKHNRSVLRDDLLLIGLLVFTVRFFFHYHFKFKFKSSKSNYSTTGSACRKWHVGIKMQRSVCMMERIFTCRPGGRADDTAHGRVST